MIDAPVLATGTRFGVYEVVRLLGRGGMGAVYEARHTGLEKAVALKVLAPQYASSAEACERFVREGRAASRIRHPHIVDVSDLGVSGSQPYLVMELLSGEDLSQQLDRETRLRPERIAEIMLPVISAVQAAHDHQIVHRDLKPENIFLATNALEGIEPKVLDFGIAKLGGESKSLTGTAVLMGTAYYMSPEQVRGAGAVGPASDQFALGVILYQCVVGVRPFEADNVLGIIHAIATGDFARPRVVAPSIPVGFEALVLRAMSMRAEDRFASVRDLGRALFAFADDETRARWAKTFGDVSGRHVSRPSSPDSKVQNTFAGAVTAPIGGPAVAASWQSGPVVPVISSAPIVSSAPLAVSEGASSTPSTFGPVTHAAPPPSPTSRAPLVIGALVVVAVVALGVTFLRPRRTPRAAAVVVTAQPTGPAPETMSLDATPASAAFSLDGTPLGEGRIALLLPVDGATHTLVVSAPGYETRTLDVGHGRPPSHIDLAPALPVGALPPPATRTVGPRAPRVRTTPAEPTPHGVATTGDRGANGALIVE